jgi:hypothetical protein
MSGIATRNVVSPCRAHQGRSTEFILLVDLAKRCFTEIQLLTHSYEQGGGQAQQPVDAAGKEGLSVFKLPRVVVEFTLERYTGACASFFSIDSEKNRRRAILAASRSETRDRKRTGSCLYGERE